MFKAALPQPLFATWEYLSWLPKLGWYQCHYFKNAIHCGLHKLKRNVKTWPKAGFTHLIYRTMRGIGRTNHDQVTMVTSAQNFSQCKNVKT